MKTKRILGDPVEKEWRRLLRKLRRQGATETTKYVSGLIKNGDYPLCYPYRLADFLINHYEFSAAGKLLKAINRSGQKHPLIDELYGTWLWCDGDHKSAIRFVQAKAKFWSKSFLFDLLSAMYSVVGEIQKAEKHLNTARILADKELANAKSRQAK